MIRINMKFNVLLTLLMLWVLNTSCSTTSITSSEPTVTILPMPSKTPLPSLPPTNVETPLQMPTVAPTDTPLAPTLTPSATPTMELPTTTPLPTLTGEEAAVAISELLLHNGGCRFPCWWGLSPGETRGQASSSFLGTFNAIAITSITDEYGIYANWFLRKENLILDISVNSMSNQEIPNTLEELHVRIRRFEGDFEVGWDNTPFAQLLQAYMLPEILSTYGHPTDALIYGNTGWKSLELMLDYADQGFAIRYIAPLERVGDTYLGCMEKGAVDLHLWNPELAYTWAEGVTKTSGGEVGEIEWLNTNFSPIEEVTSITFDKFYRTFKDSENTTCLETPVELWPGP